MHGADLGFLQAAPDRYRGDLNDIFGVGADNVHAEDFVRCLLVDDFNQAVGFIAHARRRIILERQLACFDFQSALESFFFRQTNPADGRDREYGAMGGRAGFEPVAITIFSAE